MTTDLEVLEILDNWSRKEIVEHISKYVKALVLKDKWDSMTRLKKDAAWNQAEE
jgi:hypothetical protein